ncbi:DUF624 domain-containing protein [Anaerolineae bacterium CFX9]|jgi:uncharacterized membrane protein YesL|nr:DUF624 domain-containing protein [Kamptonema cortianum]MDL1901229.1 DUF624 domain-containing protein [Anaerolineae bacterium CFX9]
MFKGLRAWWRGLRHLNHRGYIYIWGNILWFVLSLPLITAPAAWAGLMRLSHTAYHDPGVTLDAFWEGFREHWKAGIGIALFNGVLLLMTTVNLSSTRDQVGFGIDLLRAMWILSVVLALTIQLYMWPIYYSMEQPNIRGALRNAAVMLWLEPAFTLGLWIGIVLVLLFSTVFVVAWLLIAGSALASIANSAVIDRLAAAGYRTPIVSADENVPEFIE